MLVLELMVRGVIALNLNLFLGVIVLHPVL
jgi:hypothetical protein